MNMNLSTLDAGILILMQQVRLVSAPVTLELIWVYVYNLKQILFVYFSSLRYLFHQLKNYVNNLMSHFLVNCTSYMSSKRKTKYEQTILELYYKLAQRDQKMEQIIA